MKKIPLSQNKFALVDDEDYEGLYKYNWFYVNEYAVRTKLIFEMEKQPQKTIRMHRVINNTPDGFETDHINHNKLDNRKVNLRNVTRSQNAKNRKKKAKASSEYKGVYWHKNRKKWSVRIFFNKKRFYLGSYISELKAAKIYNQAAKKLFGEYAYLNKISKPE